MGLHNLFDKLFDAGFVGRDLQDRDATLFGQADLDLACVRREPVAGIDCDYHH